MHIARYQFLDRVENGDVSWIIPGKFVAFSGPLLHRRELEGQPGCFTMTAEDYVPLFQRLGITAVVSEEMVLQEKGKTKRSVERRGRLFNEYRC